MNIFICIGRLTHNPDFRTTPSGKNVCQLSVAVERDYKREGAPEADFFRVIVWGNAATACRDYLGKGSRIGIRGSLQNRSYEGRDGEKKYITEIIADKVEFLSGRSDLSNTPEQQYSSRRSSTLQRNCGRADGYDSEMPSDKMIPF